MEILTMELTHAPSPPTRHLDILFYSAPSSPRSSSALPTDDFEFDFSGHLTVPILSAADELFHAGKILPLTPQPSATLKPRVADDVPNPRGRAKNPSPRPGPGPGPGPRRGRGISRSLSPLRVSEFALQQQQQQQQQQQEEAKNNNNISSSSFSSRGSKKWRLRDLLLFRSASEGSRPLKKYPSVVVDDTTAKISSSSAGSASFRSAIGEGSSRRRSAHEIHYAANRAVSEDLKKKTSLAYKYGLLGCLGFNLSSSSGFRHFSKGFVSLSR